MPKSFLIKQRRTRDERGTLCHGNEVEKHGYVNDGTPIVKGEFDYRNNPTYKSLSSCVPPVYFPRWWWPYVPDYLYSKFPFYLKSPDEDSQETSLGCFLDCESALRSKQTLHLGEKALHRSFDDANPTQVYPLPSAPVVSTPSLTGWSSCNSPVPSRPLDRSRPGFSVEAIFNEESRCASYRPNMDVLLDVSPSSSLPEPSGADARRTLDDMNPKASKHFSCKYCEKDYMSLGALKMHIRTHTLPCRCKICGKSFSRPWLLQGHVRTHTGERPFSCSLCGRAFADRSNLRAHVQTHSDAKRYSCDRCGKAFSRMQLLTKHEEIGCYIK